MKVIIPAKSGSTRVPNKNWRSFYKDKSLVDVTVEKLHGAGFAFRDIYVSSNSVDQLTKISDRYGVNTRVRGEKTCSNDYPLTDWMRGITQKFKDESEIAWAQVCDPLFNEYDAALDAWERRGKDHDSLCVIYKTKQYLLDAQHSPVGWQFGEHHRPSQTLPTTYLMPFTFSILTRESLARCPYHIGTNPLWYETDKRGIDIDTEADFELARLIYGSVNT